MAGFIVTDKTAAYTLTNGAGAYTTEATQPVGFQHLNTVMANVGDQAIVRTESGADFEVALLTKTASQTFARTEIIESTNADAAVSWPVGATMTMALVVPADEFKGYEKDDYLINGNGQVAQIALGSTADDVYSHDQWYALTQTAALTTSQLTDVEDGVPQMIRLTQGQASAQRMGYAQIIEGQRCKKLRGKRVTLGGRLRYSNAAAVNFAILEWTGTVDAVTSDVVNDWTNGTFTAGNFFNSTTLTVRAVGTLTPAAATLTDWRVSAVLGSAFNNLIVMMWTSGTAAQNSTLDLIAQLKRGFVVAPYVFRDLGRELILAKRFLQFYDGNSGSSFANGITTSATAFDRVGFVSPVEMRATPTLTYSAGAWIYDGSVLADVATISSLTGTRILALSGTTSGAGLTANRPACFVFTSGSLRASARL